MPYYEIGEDDSTDEEAAYLDSNYPKANVSHLNSGQHDQGSSSSLSSQTSKHEDDYAADIFQDALEHLRFFQISENMDDILSKNKIFQGSSPLFGAEDYPIVVAKCVANGLSWEDVSSILFEHSHHLQIEKTVRQLYFTELAGQVQFQILDRITELCCRRERKFLNLFNAQNHTDINSDVWKKVITFKNDGDKYALLYLQWKNLITVNGAQKDKHLQKLLKKVVSSWKYLINELVPHFFDESVERALLSCIFNWFTCGEMSRFQFNQWKQYYASFCADSLSSLRQLQWTDDNHAEEHVNLFTTILIDIPGDTLTKIDDFKQLLSSFLSPPGFELVDGGSRLKVTGKGVFLQDIVAEMTKYNAKEVNLYLKYFFGIDCSLEQVDWHGINLTIVTDKLTVWKSSVIDLSGYGYCSEVRLAKKRERNAKDGSNGEDGRAGESSGNVVILTNNFRNSEMLTLKLNGGYGEGGQNGEDGINGDIGHGITEADFRKLILSYDSLYRDEWDKFEKYNPGPDWKIQERYNACVYAKFQEWIYRVYTHHDGRELTYSFASNFGMFFNTYDIMFFVQGTRGTKGGLGGTNGTSGKGGYSGDLKVNFLKTGISLKNRGTIERWNENDGLEGIPGNPGKPGKHGNDMAMVDRSSGSWSWHKREHQRFYGNNTETLMLKYEYCAAKGNALNGYRKYQEGKKDCFTSFVNTKVEVIAETECTEKKTSDQRTIKSLPVYKQTITSEKLLKEEYAEICGGDELNIGDISDFKALETDRQLEEEEKEEQHEEISILHTLAEDNQEHENNLRRAVIKTTDVAMEIDQAAKDLYHLDIVKLIDIWEKAFTAPFDTKRMEPFWKRFKSKKKNYDVIFSKNQGILANGMTRDRFNQFFKDVEKKFIAKKELSLLQMTANDVAIAEMSQDLHNEELADVEDAHLDHFWTEFEEEPYKNELLQPFFDQVWYNDISTPGLFGALYKVHKYLTREEKDVEVFRSFEQASLNWANISDVQNFLDKFLTQEELKEKEEKEKKAAEKEKERNNRKKAPTGINDNNMRAQFDDNGQVEESKEAEEEDEVENKGEEVEKSSWHNPFSSKEESVAFREVAERFKDENSKKLSFSPLHSLLKRHEDQMKRFCIDYGWTWKSVKKEPKPPGSSARSLVHMYYLTKQILDFNVRLIRYHIPYKYGITFPIDWYNSNTEVPMRSVNDLNVWSADCENKMPRIDSDMMYWLQTEGLQCRSYRQMVADKLQMNIQVFCESGFCKMRLVENLNPYYSKVYRLVVKEGKLKNIIVNEPLRKFRAVMKSCKLNIDIPLSDNTLELHRYFPEFREKICEWTDAAIVATDSEIIPRFFQRLFELRGNDMSIVELQFAFNTIIEANMYFDIPLEQLCSRILAKYGVINDIFLAFRVMGCLKGKIPFENLIKLLSEINEPQIKALFGSKLHEIQMTERILNSLVSMLAHADGRVAQLEKMHLQEWVDIANCQRWNSYGPLLEAYGNVGYYMVLLDTFGNEERQRFERIIKKLKNETEKVILLEKIISTLTFLISNKEVIFTDDYENSLFNFLKLISRLIKVVTDILKCSLRCEDVEELDSCVTMNNSALYLITNERLQYVLINNVIGTSAKEWDYVMPRSDRTLEEVIRLSVNPQDIDQAKCERKEEMNIVEGIISGKIEHDYALWLRKIDDALEKCYGKRLRDTQKIAILSAIRSEKNLLSQVNTGEGKTYLISCLAILRILINRADTVDIITSSSVLAQRDAEAMKMLYKEFKIEVGHNCDEDVEKRKMAYKCQVVYGDIARFERDNLLQTFYKRNILGSRTRCNVIVDEVDVMLLDNGSNMLYLSHNVAGLELLDSLFVYLHKLVNTPSLNEAEQENFSSARLRQKVLADMCGLITKEDINGLLFDENDTTIAGKAWRMLVTQNVINSEGVLQDSWNYDKLAAEFKRDCNTSRAERICAMLEMVKNRRQEIGIPGYLKPFVIRHLDEFIKNAKQGLFLKHNDEYVVDLDHTGRSTDLHPVITIIDKGTGTDLSTSQWSEGLHQFVQLKHGCRLTPFTLKAVFISNVSYLKGYRRLNGFSGTLGSVEENNSLVELYNADMVKIPTWKPKMFNEKVPILSRTKEEWFKNIFDEVCNQITASRSVLVICQSIEKVEELDKEFKQLYRKIRSPSTEVETAFNSTIIYTREFDEFDFTSNKSLPPCKIIISTNLSGRGTDITLSEELVKNGGLHVIVSFLPENSRIENQAYGRASRGGQKGSGQIICMVHEDNGASNIFQLKQFRDNAEVHRLRSLKQYYVYHIAIEEACLKLLQEHCSKVMETVHTTSENLTITQVVYFALLDEWAEWLDSKSEEIKQCERAKNDGLKEYIMISVKKFLEAHPFPEGDDYSKSLEWIKCPQPLLSIALIHLESDKIDLAGEILDKIIKEFPEFQAEAYYYKGIIEQWTIHKAREILPPPEKDEDGKIVQAKPGNRLKTVKWITKNVFFSDDCPENYVERCWKSVQQATEYLLLSRSFFATRIRKIQGIVEIINILQKKSTSMTSRGFSAQQKEAIAVLECFIGSIDDLLGHRAQPDDVKQGDEDYRLTIRRFKEYVKRADIITPPQLAEKKISDQQLHIISINHCLPPNILENALQRIKKDDQIEEYDGQKIVKAGELAKVITLPSVTGFWESLRRAGCFYSEQVFIAVKKGDKSKVPVLKPYETTHFELGPLQLQLSTENLKEYDLYDVHGAAGKIKEDSAENVELEEAREAGLVHIEVVATINYDALFTREYLDQFSFLDVNRAATELRISHIEAKWILDTLEQHGIVKRVLAKVTHPKQPEANNKVGMTKADSETEKSNEQQDATIGTPSTSASSSIANIIGDRASKKEIIETHTAYFPKARVDCSMFPANMRSSIEMMLSRNFCYHYVLKSLKASMEKVINGEAVTHQISCLPTDPYADLYNDLQNMGVIRHSRVTSVLKDIYKPEVDNFVLKYFKAGVAHCSSKVMAAMEKCSYPYFDQENAMVRCVRMGTELKSITYSINPVIYKQLEGKSAKLCTRKCDLVATSAYLGTKNVPASSEIRKTISNGLRKVAVVSEKSWWKWMHGTFVTLLPITVPILLAAVAFPVILPYVLVAMAGVAVVGTTLYCMKLITENQKVAATLNLGQEEEFHILRSYHESAVEAPKKAKRDEIQRKEMKKSLDSFTHLLIHRLGLATYVTSSDEDISLWLEALDHCCQKSTHLPLLQQAIELWFKYNTLNMQASQFDRIFKRMENNNQELPKVAAAPRMIFAFCSILIAKVNLTKKDRDGTRKGIKTQLNFAQFPANPNISVSPSNTDCPLSLALSDSLKKILTPMIEESITATVDPALSRLDVAWRKRQESKIVAIEQDEEVLKKKKLQHNAEKLARKQTVDFLATDLHNIFQRIAFRGISKRMLQHMIKFNYPLSPHCAEKIFNASAMVLLDIDSDMKQLDIELKRGEQTIFTYNGRKNGFAKKEQSSLVIGLNKDSFYIIELKELTGNHRSHLGLFQALCEYSTKFCDTFALDSQAFVEQMHETIAKDLDSKWSSTVSWYGNEKLKCAVVYWYVNDGKKL